MKAVIVLTTVGASFDVTRLAQTLIDEHLAACVNVLPPMQSIYRWQGQVHVDDERQLVIKTSSDRVEALQLRLRALHPYELPEFLVIDVASGSQPYLAWLSQATTPTMGSGL
jgi:periplasmic divalent cation tolerance protein